ncbi:MAG TPA: hypothetical protein VMN36_11060 [Verrucomicrobiales bacterium]|nr:hypothetical protein [Verrucomicrobiales bacterium]
MNRPLPPVLAAKLAGYRRQVWVVKLAEGLLAALFALGVSYLLVLLLDRIIETPVWLRFSLLIAAAAVTGLGLPLKWHRWVWRQRRLEDAARLLRWKFPRLGDQLLGIVELAREDLVTGRSERLVQAAMDQAGEEVKDLDFSGAVPQPSHWKWAGAAVAASVLIAMGFGLINDAARNALARWLTPWRNVERFTFAQVEDIPDPLVVPLAESFTLPVSLREGARWKPDEAVGRVARQPAVSAKRAGMGYELSFPPQKQDAQALLKVGDVRERIRVEPRPRPELTELQVRLDLPDYLRYETEPVIEVRGASVSIVQGARAIFEARVSRELAQAALDGVPVSMEGDRLVSEPLEVPEERDLTFTWKDALGLTPLVPLVLQARPIEDEAPRLVARRESQEQVVLDSEVVAFDVSASDDFGIRHIGLEWRGVGDGQEPDVEASEVAGWKIASAGAPEMKQLEARATFSAKREGIAPQTVEVRAWAEDYAPGRERSRSATFVLHVLSPDDHAIWVTQQMARWLEAAQETYEREQRLHQTNKELRSLSAEDLDRPENRRRVALQASAETANSERLGALTEAGRNLVDQATRNPEFDAERLESWALMLRMLQDIAANRMPSVADLLKESADAKADAQLASNHPGAQNPAESPPGSSDPAQQAEPGEDGASNVESAQAGNGQGQAGLPQESLTAPALTQGPQSPKAGGPQTGSPPDSSAKPAAPSISLTESTMNTPKAGDDAASSGKTGPAPLTLPSNSLASPPSKGGGSPPASSAQESLEEGIQEQSDLLAEFAKVADQLNEILASLEASTFVKRFKAAARQQLQLASNLGEKTLDAFGIVRENPDMSAPLPAVAAGDREEPVPSPEPAPEPLPAAVEPEPPFVTTFAPLASKKAKDQSDVVRVILSDLEAYYQRRPDLHFKKVIGEMKEVRVVQELTRVGERAADNYSGNAIHAAELWADTMDRWAEEMVSVGRAFC